MNKLFAYLFSIYLTILTPSVLTTEINQYRKDHGVSLVNENALLNTSATKKACDMYKRGYWSHDTPEGTPFFILIKKVGYWYRIAGENIIRNNTDPKIMVEKWSKSPTHNKVMLDGRYTDIGVGYCGNIVVTHYGDL